MHWFDKLIHIWSGWSIPMLFISMGLEYVLVTTIGLFISKYIIIGDVQYRLTALGFIIGTLTFFIVK